MCEEGQRQKGNKVDRTSSSSAPLSADCSSRSRGDDLAGARSPRASVLGKAFDLYLEYQEACNHMMRSAFYKDHFNSNLEGSQGERSKGD